MPAARASCSSGAMRASPGARPGLLSTNWWPPRCAAVSSPPISVAPGISSRSAMAPGGVARLSHTVSRAPCCTHQRAMARPLSPRPRISTGNRCKKCTGGGTGTGASSVRGTSGGSCGGRATGSAECAAGAVCEAGSPGSPVSSGSAGGSPCSAGILARCGACGTGSSASGKSPSSVSASSGGTWSGGKSGTMSGGRRGSGVFIAVSGSPGPPGTAAW
jgi:hypothetical protein